MSLKSHFWLVAAQIVTVDDKSQEHRFSMNVLLNTKADAVARKDLAKAQEAALQRFAPTFEQLKGHTLKDVFLLSISNLGLQSQVQFHAGFSDAGEGAAANQVN
ncbi:hypothetical protein [Mesorhizobium sp. M7A.F.Ca.CA.002.12.1.1]|uniref:hypothetical protein n=1 Tax=Mesorhizobium sp. M7A.F.Ca.CA.002.12.1.1 TaxID=2496735 RepID=UPI000FCC60EF|nr:hypothetical protein [Mesorhizobium sp. M7A.F.Ca.CA.002.12.1.1]RUX60181.1 hypothetical protein EN989_11240 [Mesorhizobium sp. M7A.F.Ca.CA.002.12.1.1]